MFERMAKICSDSYLQVLHGPSFPSLSVASAYVNKVFEQPVGTYKYSLGGIDTALGPLSDEERAKWALR